MIKNSISVVENENGYEKYYYGNANKIMMWQTVPGTTWKMQTAEKLVKDLLL